MADKIAAGVEVRNFTRRKAPVFPYKEIASAILPSWEISLVFCGETRARNLNVSLRNKSYIPNVLSYECGNKSGEIIICLPIANKQAPTYDLSYTHHTAFLFIHGLLHLKGNSHGHIMEKNERTFLKRFTGATLEYGDDR